MHRLSNVGRLIVLLVACASCGRSASAGQELSAGRSQSLPTCDRQELSYTAIPTPGAVESLDERITKLLRYHTPRVVDSATVDQLAAEKTLTISLLPAEADVRVADHATVTITGDDGQMVGEMQLYRVDDQWLPETFIACSAWVQESSPPVVEDEPGTDKPVDIEEVEPK